LRENEEVDPPKDEENVYSNGAADENSDNENENEDRNDEKATDGNGNGEFSPDECILSQSFYWIIFLDSF
jgi:hypothetical protein